MPLLKNGAFVVDRWTLLADGDAIPVDRPVIVDLRRLRGDDAEYLFHRGCELAVRLAPDDDIATLEPWLDRLSMVVLTFPKFNDGRAFSSARLLRERYGFAKEIRAVGDVLVDQYPFMLQCGFDSFEIAEGRALESWRDARVDLSLRYQTDTLFGPGMDVLSARHRARPQPHKETLKAA